MKSRFQDSALVLVDLQKDFCPGGALGVPEGDQVIGVINGLMPEFPLVVATQDWHTPDHVSFVAQGGTWPPHCVQGTPGADLHPDLDTRFIGAYLKKGYGDKDAYSGFQATDESGRSLDGFLKERGVRAIYVAGLATDYCVRATVLDGLAKGYEVYVVTDATRAVNVEAEDGEKALAEMAARGARLVVSDQLIKLSRARRSGAE